jgi:hypothetical protein
VRAATSGPPLRGGLNPYAAFLLNAVAAKPDITMPALCSRLDEAHALPSRRRRCRGSFVGADLRIKTNLSCHGARPADVREKRRLWNACATARSLGVCRRDGGYHQDGAAARTIATRHEAAGRRAIRPLGRRPPSPACAAVNSARLDRRQGNGSSRFRPLGRDGTRPTLAPGDIVIFDNLAVHTSVKAVRILRDKSA